MNQENLTFAHWAIVEVFGHEKYAGHVSTEQVGGVSMLRLDVPEVQNMEVTLPAFCKFLNPSSVFSITPVSEEYAVQMAVKLSKHPIEGYEHREVIKQLAKRATEQMTLAEIRKLTDGGSLISADGGDDDEDLNF